jgi:hypothetical protein
MASRSRHLSHDKYKTRIDNLLKTYKADTDSSPESQSHKAKYLAVLVSGYLEQAIKEVLLAYASIWAQPQILRYIEKSWPRSMNMNTQNINSILIQFNETWATNFDDWLDEAENRKGDINSLVNWRNSIAHGTESNTNNVTFSSVEEKFSTVKSFVAFLESTLKPV